MKNRGIFSDDFSDVFSGVLEGQFGTEFPSKSGELPDPSAVVTAPEAPVAEIPDFPSDVFDFDFSLPERAASKAAENSPIISEADSTSSGAVPVDYGPLLAPGGNGGGKPGTGDEPGGGGGGKPDKDGGGGGGGGGKKGDAQIYISGDADTETVDNFNIMLEFVGDFSSASATALVRYLQASAEFLSNIITTGFTDDPEMFRPDDTRKKFLVDDLYVQISLGNPGFFIGAETQVYAANDWDGDYSALTGAGSLETPAGATIEFNSQFLDTLETAGTLDDLALHEMIHALGFGLWEVAGNDLTSVVDGTLVYTGDGANGEIVEVLGADGSVGSHWAESVYDEELMTSNLETTDTMYLEYFSIATLADLAVIDVNTENGTGYALANDWQTQIDELNGTAQLANGSDDSNIGIDLDYWAGNIA